MDFHDRKKTWYCIKEDKMDKYMTIMRGGVLKTCILGNKQQILLSGIHL